MKLKRRHSTRDHFGVIFFVPLLIVCIFGGTLAVWAQGKMVVSLNEPLSIFGVGIMAVLLVWLVKKSVDTYTEPWFTSITDNNGVYTFIALRPKDTVVIQKANIVSATIQYYRAAHYGSSVAAHITYTDSNGQHLLRIQGVGSWQNEAGAILRGERFCKAVVSAFTQD